MRRRRTNHPLIRLVGTAARLPRYLNLAQALVRDPAVPATSKAALALGIAYAISPIDLVPGIIPVVGQLDDLAALLLGLRLVLTGSPAAVVESHLDAAGLAPTALEADLRTVRETAAWAVGGTLSMVTKTVRNPVRRISTWRRSSPPFSR